MQLGMIGLGRMGSSLVRRLSNDGHDCVVFDVNPAAVNRMANGGIPGAVSIADLLSKLARPRVVWLMVPAGVTGKAVQDVASNMDSGDIIIDGGNSYYRDDVLRAATLKHAGIHYPDCGTSGGADFANRALSAMRKQFGGHEEKPK